MIHSAVVCMLEKGGDERVRQYADTPVHEERSTECTERERGQRQKGKVMEKEKEMSERERSEGLEKRKTERERRSSSVKLSLTQIL